MRCCDSSRDKLSRDMRNSARRYPPAATWQPTLMVSLLLCSQLVYVDAFAVKRKAQGTSHHFKPQPSSSTLGVYSEWAVSTDAAPCAGVARKIFGRNGTLADAAVATMLCMGVVLPDSVGIGGGFMATVYNKSAGEAWCLMAREKAPLGATKDMFVKDIDASMRGGKAIGVPGELRGYQALLDRMGTNLGWKALFDDAINLARNGFPIGKHLGEALQTEKEHIPLYRNMKKVFWNATTNDTLVTGSKLIQEDLAKTLEEIAAKGADHFYKGELAAQLVEEIKSFGGILSATDLANYTVDWVRPISRTFKDGHTMYSTPPPGSGAVLAYLLSIMDEYRKSEQDKLSDDVLTLHRFAEASKFAYAKRSLLGDQRFVDVKRILESMTSAKAARRTREMIHDDAVRNDTQYYNMTYYAVEDHGTAHVSILGPGGDAIAITSSINYYFGSFLRTNSGILLNNHMNDFSTPGFKNVYNLEPSPANFIEPGKRPMSSMTPSVFVNKSTGDVDLVVGGIGGSKITSAVALVTMRTLWQGDDIKRAIDYPRLHHQLIPRNLSVEREFPELYVKELEAKGHVVDRPAGMASVVLAVRRVKDKINANADYRKGGGVDGQ